MLLNHPNSKKQGDVGLGTAIGWFVANMYTVCVPLTDSQDYDIVVDNGKRLLKVQVKTTRYKRNGFYVAALKISGGNKTRSTIKPFDSSRSDLLFILDNDGNKYLIPSIECGCTGSITLSKKYQKYIVR